MIDVEFLVNFAVAGFLWGQAIRCFEVGVYAVRAVCLMESDGWDKGLGVGFVFVLFLMGFALLELAVMIAGEKND